MEGPHGHRHHQVQDSHGAQVKPLLAPPISPLGPFLHHLSPLSPFLPLFALLCPSLDLLALICREGLHGGAFFADNVGIMIDPRNNTGLQNASRYLNMTATLFKENQIPSAHLRCVAVQ